MAELDLTEFEVKEHEIQCQVDKNKEMVEKLYDDYLTASEAFDNDNRKLLMEQFHNDAQKCYFISSYLFGKCFKIKDNYLWIKDINTHVDLCGYYSIDVYGVHISDNLRDEIYNMKGEMQYWIDIINIAEEISREKFEEIYVKSSLSI